MKKAILFFVSIITITYCNAQTVKGNLEGKQTFVVGNNFILAGYIKDANKAIFKAVLYSSELKVLKEYEKNLPEDIEPLYSALWSKGSYVSESLEKGILSVFVKFKNSKKYVYSNFIKLTDDLKEISSVEKVIDDNVKTIPKVENDDKHKTLSPYFQDGIEGSLYGLAGLGTYMTVTTGLGFGQNSMSNQRLLNTDIIDFDRKTGIITRNKLNESEIDYSEVWKAKLNIDDKIKLLGFTYVDEDDIIGCFIVKEKKWNNYICRLDAKTGAIKFMVPVKHPDEIEGIYLSAFYFDKQNNNLIVAEELCSSKSKKKRDAIAILSFDKRGILINSQKINLPEYDVKEPGGFNFKHNDVMIDCMGKLPNGNYFLDNINTASYTSSAWVNAGKADGHVESSSIQLIVGFSYYELDEKLNLVNSNFKIEENFANPPPFVTYNNPAINYIRPSKDGKYVFLTETYKKTKSLKMIDISSKDGKTTELKYMDDFKPKDNFSVIFLDNSLIMFRQNENSDFELTTTKIK